MRVLFVFFAGLILTFRATPAPTTPTPTTPEPTTPTPTTPEPTTPIPTTPIPTTPSPTSPQFGNCEDPEDQFIASCDTTIFGNITEGIDEINCFQLVLDQSYDVQLSTCNSFIDPTIIVTDENGNDISSGTYCIECETCDPGDDCGFETCAAAGRDRQLSGGAEDFIIPLQSGTYYLQISPCCASGAAPDGNGEFQIDINCIVPSSANQVAPRYITWVTNDESTIDLLSQSWFLAICGLLFASLIFNIICCWFYMSSKKKESSYGKVIENEFVHESDVELIQ